MTKHSTVGLQLRRWREQRGLSQLALSEQAGVSQRHISRVETGLSKPTEAMIWRLAECLEIPARELATLAFAAGVALPERKGELPSHEIDHIREAVATMLNSHEPFPAVAMNHSWDIEATNVAAIRFFAWLTEWTTLPESLNGFEMCFDPTMIRPYVDNWRELALMMLARLRRELDSSGDERLRELLQRVQRYEGVAELVDLASRSDSAISYLPIFQVSVRKGNIEARFFTTVTTFGTSVDKAYEKRIETYHPTDEATRALWSALAHPDAPL